MIVIHNGIIKKQNKFFGGKYMTDSIVNKTAKAFLGAADPADANAAADIPVSAMTSSPASVLQSYEELLSKMVSPLPAGQVLSTLAKNVKSGGNTPASGLVTELANSVLPKLMPRILDDGQLSREELVRTVGETGNDIDMTTPDPAVMQQASAMLQRFGIADTDGSLAQGTARAATLTSSGLNAGLHTAQENTQRIAPVPSAAPRP